MKVALLENYAPDQQQSMLRFGAMLRRHAEARGWNLRVIAPRPSGVSQRLGRSANAAMRKWLGYLDKYVLFPPRLRREVRAFGSAERVLVHIVDHSNAVYVPRVPDSETRWIATCHDLLAVRGSLGEDTDCPASALGRRLQRAIVRGLGRSDAVACDSTSTLCDLERLVVPARLQARCVIFLGLNHSYRRVDAVAARARLRSIEGVPWEQPFVLHVGSNLGRKNKSGVLRVFGRLAGAWPGNLVFCGAPLTPELRAQAARAGVSARVFAVPAPDNAQLEAAYSLAHALHYPSKCEGFGWPMIEAQACGCPVVCSDRTSLPEIGGEAALVHALDDEAGMAESLRRLGSSEFRAAVAARGLDNIQRFKAERMIDAYHALYKAMLGASSR